jgi:hypothetical protein
LASRKGIGGHDDKNRVAEWLTPNPASQSGYKGLREADAGRSQPRQRSSGPVAATGFGGALRPSRRTAEASARAALARAEVPPLQAARRVYRVRERLGFSDAPGGQLGSIGGERCNDCGQPITDYGCGLRPLLIRRQRRDGCPRLAHKHKGREVQRAVKGQEQLAFVGAEMISPPIRATHSQSREMMRLALEGICPAIRQRAKRLAAPGASASKSSTRGSNMQLRPRQRVFVDKSSCRAR